MTWKRPFDQGATNGDDVAVATVRTFRHTATSEYRLRKRRLGRPAVNPLFIATNGRIGVTKRAMCGRVKRSRRLT